MSPGRSGSCLYHYLPDLEKVETVCLKRYLMFPLQMIYDKKLSYDITHLSTGEHYRKDTMKKHMKHQAARMFRYSKDPACMQTIFTLSVFFLSVYWYNEINNKDYIETH